MKKLKNIKIIFIDIDGTLTNSKRCLEEVNKDAILKITNKDIYVVLCSGRTNQYVCDLSKQANASCYAISCNGALVYDYQRDKDIFNSNLNLQEVTTLWNYCLENHLGFIINTKEMRYGNHYLHNVKENGIKPIHSINEINNIDIYQIVITSSDEPKMNELKTMVNEIPSLFMANISTRFVDNLTVYFFDIVNVDINKGQAIKHLLNYLNIKKEESVCIGDHINDYQMFNEVGFKVAMKNANKELIKQADYVTLSNDENGVAHFLNNFIE